MARTFVTVREPIFPAVPRRSRTRQLNRARQTFQRTEIPTPIIFCRSPKGIKKKSKQKLTKNPKMTEITINNNVSRACRTCGRAFVNIVLT